MTSPIRTAIWSTTGSEITGRPFWTRTSRSETLKPTGTDREYVLYLATCKDDVRRERLRKPDETRYGIYNAINKVLPRYAGSKRLEKLLGNRTSASATSIAKIPITNKGYCFRKKHRELSGSKSTMHSTLRSSIVILPMYSSNPASGRTPRKSLGGGRQLLFGITGLLGNMNRGGSTREKPSSVNLGKAKDIPLPSVNSSGRVPDEQLQQKPEESPEKHSAHHGTAEGMAQPRWNAAIGSKSRKEGTK